MLTQTLPTNRKFLNRQHLGLPEANGTARADLLHLDEWGYASKSLIGNKRFEFFRGPNLASIVE